MNQNVNFTFLICCVFGFMAIATFSLWLNIQKIGWKGRDQDFDSQREFLPHEKKAIRENRRKIIWTIAIGFTILFIFYLLHGIGVLFPVSTK